jgi:uncharacterized protein with FMN-binding domain/Pyruvate/2-oxoacid:ferredoxin oxidoreductase delta subunit
MFLAISLVFDRPFCNYLCVEGARHGLFSAFRPVTISRNEDTCVDCGKCNRVCPMNIEISSHEQVRSLQCIDCMACATACPVEGTLKIGFVPLRKKIQRIGLPFMIFGAIACFSYVLYNEHTVASAAEQVYTVAVDESILADAETGDAAGVADGTYEGTGTGFKGTMTVSVTVQDEIITAVDILSTGDDANWLNRAYSGVPADILSEQTAEVDSVSGATYSSMGIKEAVANALVNAGSTEATEIVNDLPSAGQGRRRGH